MSLEADLQYSSVLITTYLVLRLTIFSRSTLSYGMRFSTM
jgi:hypothetical protein